MSHFTTVETKINSLAALAAAAAKLGRPYHPAGDGTLKARGWQGNRLACAALIDFGRYDVAAVRDEGPEESYTLVADWWAIATDDARYRGRPITDVSEELLREYALERVVETCEAEGYTIDRSQIQIAADGSMELVAESWWE